MQVYFLIAVVAATILSACAPAEFKADSKSVGVGANEVPPVVGIDVDCPHDDNSDDDSVDPDDDSVDGVSADDNSSDDDSSDDTKPKHTQTSCISPNLPYPPRQ